jgi:anti-sigma regulatory factor (Ser/Thr protein kinase)
MWRRLLKQFRNWRGHAAAQHAAVADGAKPPLMVALDSAAHTWLFRVPRNRGSITDFCAMIEKRLPPGYASLDTLRAFQVAFDELLTNVVAHTTEFPDDPIEVLLKREPERILAVIRYRGAPFDPTQQPPPNVDAQLHERPIGGLGVHLVRTMMHEFRHTYIAGFNELTLYRKADL